MKKSCVWCVVVVLAALALSACGSKHSSPTSPSRTDEAPQPVDLTQKVYVQITRYQPDKMVVNVYGRLGWGLENPNLDANGATLRLRVFTGDKFVTFITGVYNGTPIGSVNNTIIRDISTPASVDMTLTLEPYGCKSMSCWVKFNFADQSRVQLLPDRQYKLVPKNGEVHIMGDVPPVQVAGLIPGF